MKHRRLPHRAQPGGLFDLSLLYLAGSIRSSNAPDSTTDPFDDFGIISLASSVGRDESLFSSHDKGSLSSFERYEHHDTVVSLDQLDGMWCKDPLIEADLPATKQSCSLPTQRD